MWLLLLLLINDDRLGGVHIRRRPPGVVHRDVLGRWKRVQQVLLLLEKLLLLQLLLQVRRVAVDHVLRGHQFRLAAILWYELLCLVDLLLLDEIIIGRKLTLAINGRLLDRLLLLLLDRMCGR